jgi:hypothetical protein
LKQLDNEELRDLYSLQSIIRITRSRRMGWAGHVARMGENRNAFRLLVEKPEGGRYEVQDVGGWILLRWILERWDGVMLTGLVWLKTGTGGELL